ncbi:type IV pilus assembly protein PilM [Patescibacteria group bacterium]|nr:type IV pilus assembly protein PilM [Patescibacteria group bacterium]
MAKNIFTEFFPKIIRIWSQHQSVVGVDIGSSSIKIVQLRKEKERAFLETYGELAAGPYVKQPIGQIVQLSEGVATEMLKDLFRESGANAKEAAVAIPVKSSFITTIKVPMVEDKKTMDEVIKFEARKYIPVPFNEVEVDWWILNTSEPESSGIAKRQIVEVLLAVIYKDAIRKYQNILSGSNLKIKLFEVEIFSGWRSLIFRPTTPVAVIDLGASSTKMSIVEAGVLRSSFTIDAGACAITNAISRSLGISFERAEEMKQQIGLSSKPEHKDIVKVSESVLNLIFSEAKQFIHAYNRKYNSSVGQVVLSGGGALLNGVVDMAVKNLGVEVVLADPFAKTDYPPFLQGVLKEIGPTFSTAAGLALKGLS